MTGGLRVRAVSVLLLLATACASTPEPVRAAPTPRPKAVDARAVRVQQLLSAGRAAAREQRWPDAEASLQETVNAAYGFGSPWAHYRADALSELARCLLAQGRAAEAHAAATQGLAPLRPGSEDTDQRILELQTMHAEAFLKEQQPAMAVAPFEAAAQAGARHATLAPARLAVSLRLAETLEALGRRQDATWALERALGAARRPETGAALTRRLAHALAALYGGAGEHAKARALLAELAPEDAPATSTDAATATATATGTATATPAARPAAEPPSTAEAPSNATEVVAMQADFRACYRAAVKDHADVAGRVALVISIAADGHVSNVKAKASRLPVSAVDCLKRRASIARFEPPKGGGAVITVPVTFVKQEND